MWLNYFKGLNLIGKFFKKVKQSKRKLPIKDFKNR